METPLKSSRKPSGLRWLQDLPAAQSKMRPRVGTIRSMNSHAVERVRAAAEVVRALPFAFTPTARAENYLVGRPDLRDTIKRLQAYQEVGADVLYAPGLLSKDDIAAVVKSVDRPVNVVMGLRGVQSSLAVLSELGVRRVSVGSALSRAPLVRFFAPPGRCASTAPLAPLALRRKRLAFEISAPCLRHDASHQ